MKYTYAMKRTLLFFIDKDLYKFFLNNLDVEINSDSRNIIEDIVLIYRPSTCYSMFTNIEVKISCRINGDDINSYVKVMKAIHDRYNEENLRKKEE